MRSGDPGLLDEVRRLTGLAGIELVEVPPGAAPPRTASVLLDDVTEPGGRAWRDVASGGLVLDVAGGGTSGGPDVLRLPEDGEALLRVLVEAAAPERARVLGVVGATGGAGASVLAAVLSRQAVAAGLPTALVDLDPCGGGLDVLLGLEHDPGPRWGDLLTERGGFPPDRLALALPSWESVRVLSGDLRSGVGTDDAAAHAAVRALARAVDLLVLDLPRSVLAPPGTAAWLAACSDVVVVAGCDIRSAAAAAGAARVLGSAGVPAHLVARGPGPGALTADDVADAAELPLAATMRAERSLAAGLERGAAPGDNRRGPLMAAGRRVLRELGVP